MARRAQFEQRATDGDGEQRSERLAERHVRKAAQAKPQQERGQRAGDVLNSELAINVSLHGLALALHYFSVSPPCV